MPKFLFLAHGEMDQSPESREAHMKWWSAMQDHVVDPGNPLFNGRNVPRGGLASHIPNGTEQAFGYTIVQADSMTEAVSLLEDCPIDMWIYEARPV